MRTMLYVRTLSRVATWAVLGLLWGCSESGTSTTGNQMTEPSAPTHKPAATAAPAPVPAVKVSDLKLNLDRKPGDWLPDNQLTDDINTETPELLDDLFEKTGGKKVAMKGRLLTAEDREKNSEVEGMELEFRVKTK